MHQTQILSYGAQGALLTLLQELAQARRCWLRETSQVSACLNLAHTTPPSVLVLRLGTDLPRELELLEQVHACLPGTAVIAVGEAENPALAGLVWELGATCALFPPTPMEQIHGLIERILDGGAP